MGGGADDQTVGVIRRSKMGSVALTVALTAAGFLALMYFGQRVIMYPAPAAVPPPLADRAEVVSLTLPAGTVEALFLPPSVGRATPAPLMIFAHGNGELADYWIDAFGPPRSWGWNVLLLEYPGYGRSEGSPSEASISTAALAAYDWARDDPRVDTAAIVAYGRSLGGGAVTQIAAARPLAALILESSFTSVRPLAARMLMPGPLVRDQFDNLSALKDYRGPMLVVHGAHDDIIPVSHGRALAAAVPGASFHEVQCGHNDCPRPWAAISAFLASNRLLAPAARE